MTQTTSSVSSDTNTTNVTAPRDSSFTCDGPQPQAEGYKKLAVVNHDGAHPDASPAPENSDLADVMSSASSRFSFVVVNPTHVVEILGVPTERVESTVKAIPGALNAYTRDINDDCTQVKLWVVVDDLRVVEDLAEQHPDNVRIVGDEEALPSLPAYSECYVVRLKDQPDINISRSMSKVHITLSHEQSKKHLVKEAAKGLAKSCGEIHHIQVLEVADNQAVFLVEFEKLSAVHDLINLTGYQKVHELMNGISALVCPVPLVLAAAFCDPHSIEYYQSLKPKMQVSETGRTSWIGNQIVNPQSLNGPSMANYPNQVGHGYAELDPDLVGAPTGPRNKKRPFDNAGRRFNRYGSRLSQDVDIERIEIGMDVRTTIMIRNLHCHIDFSYFKRLLDMTSRGQYDFIYVRMDFKKRTNVGYAFINFARPEFIIPFMKARVGRPWPSIPRSRKVEISYATIQGQDCLIQKFRNSAIMEEFTNYRPKLFYSIDSMTIPAGKQPGDECVFPATDNPQKLARSIDNAKVVGLFRHGRHGGHQGGRRHFSQYDRGNLSAVAEETAFCSTAGRHHGANGHYTTTPAHMGHGHMASVGYPANVVPRYVPNSVHNSQAVEAVNNGFYDPGSYHVPTATHFDQANAFGQANASGPNYRY